MTGCRVREEEGARRAAGCGGQSPSERLPGLGLEFRGRAGSTA